MEQVSSVAQKDVLTTEQNEGANKAFSQGDVRGEEELRLNLTPRK